MNTVDKRGRRIGIKYSVADPRPVKREIKLNSDKFSIAFYIGGGLGDTVRSTDVSWKLRQQFPEARIDAYADKFAEDVYSGNLFVDSARSLTPMSWSECIKMLSANYDIVYDLRYVAKEIKRRGVVGLVDQDEWDYKWRSWYDKFLVGNNEIGRLGYHCIELTARTIGLPTQVRPILFPDELTKFRLPDKYIVIAPESDAAITGRQTKCWSASNWNKLLSMLPDIATVQVGVGKFERLDVDIHLERQTSVRDLISIVNGATETITIEGGIAHVAAALDKHATVLFGPTPVQFFSYAWHTAVSANVCEPCWWLTREWFHKCYLFDEPVCMNRIEPELVAQKVIKFLGG